MLYNNLTSLLNQNLKHKIIDPTFETTLNNFFKKQNIIVLLNDILNSPELIKKISERSYLHTLGFYKLVLVDSNKDLSGFNNKTQVRLHLWKPDNYSVPVVESLHEHSFNFVSTLLTGKLENQSFIRKELTSNSSNVLNKLLTLLPTLNNETKNFLEDQIDILLTYRFKALGSEQFDILQKQPDMEKIKSITEFNEEEIELLTSIQGFYKSNRVAGEKKDYKHILDKYIELEPYSVLKIKPGQTYFHDYKNPHRLFYDNKEYNSTILITTHIPENPEGGSFQRPTHNENGEQNYGKQPITEKELVYLLEEYIDELSK